MTRIGFNVNVESGLDWPYYLDTMRRLRPPFSLHLRDWDLRKAREVIAVTAGQTKVIVRFPDSGDGEKFHWRQGDDFIHKSLDAWETLPGATDPNVYFNILNEPPTSNADDVQAICGWLSRFMHTASQRGLKLCVFNSGVDQSLHLDEGRYDELLRTLALYKGQHLLGVHEYAGPSMPNSVSHPPEWMRDIEHLDKLQPENWPSAGEIQVARQNGAYPPYWLQFRGVWLALRSRELGLGDPDIVVSEWGWDRIPNLEAKGVYAALEQRYGWPRDGWGQVRGINTLDAVWKGWWPQWTIAEAPFHQFEWWERVAPDCYKGACYFSWWPSPEWSDMDIAGRRVLHSLMIEAAQKPPELVPLPEPIPVPEPEPIPLPEPEPIPEPAPIPVPIPTPTLPVFNWTLVGWLIAGILAGLLVYLSRTRITAQAEGASIMWETLAILAGGCNRATEGFKRLLAFTPWFADPEQNAELRRFITLMASMVIGVVMVGAANSAGTLFIGTPFTRYPEAFLTVAFGLAVGAGSNFIAWLENVYNVNKAIKLAQAAQAAQTGTAQVSLEVKATEPTA